MKIIKSCLKNLLINLKYYFVPLGISMFFFIIALSIGIPLCINSIKVTFNGIAAEVGGATFDWMSAFNKIVEKMMSLDQTQGVDAILVTISDKNWIIATLTDVAKALFGESISGKEIVDMIQNCANTIVASLTYILIMALVGFIVSIFVIMVTVRKTMTKTGWIRAILYSLVDTIIFVGFILLYLEIKPSALWVRILVSIAYAIVTILISFIESYLFYGLKKLKVKEVINIKNILFWLIGNILALIVGVAITLLPILIIPWYGGIILAIPFVEIVFLVIHMNSDGYIHELASGEIDEVKIEKPKAVREATK